MKRRGGQGQGNRTPQPNFYGASYYRPSRQTTTPSKRHDGRTPRREKGTESSEIIKKNDRKPLSARFNVAKYADKAKQLRGKLPRVKVKVAHDFNAEWVEKKQAKLADKEAKQQRSQPRLDEKPSEPTPPILDVKRPTLDMEKAVALQPKPDKTPPPERDTSQPMNARQRRQARDFARKFSLSAYRPEARESDRIHERNLRAWRRRLAGMLALLIFLLVAGGLLLSQFNGTISGVESDIDLSPEQAREYEALANDYFTRHSIERFGFALHRDSLSQSIAAAAPEVESARITAPTFLSGKLELVFRRPVASWTVDGEERFVDAAGVVFVRNYFDQPTIQIVDNSGVATDEEMVNSSRFLAFVGQVVAGVNDADGLSVSRVEIPPQAIRYINIYLDDRAYPFRAQIDRDPSGQAQDIVSMANYLTDRNLTPAEYVDTRVAGKAYWK